MKSKGKKGESYEEVIKKLIKPEHMEDLQQAPRSSDKTFDESQTEE